MRIGILSLPSNFHCQKWKQALEAYGEEVFVFSLEKSNLPNTIWIPPKIVWNKKYRFPAYYFSAPLLKQKLIAYQIEVLYALHISPFGVWAMWSGFKPLIVAAMGADVFEYSQPTHRAWRYLETQPKPFTRFKEKLLSNIYTKLTHQTLQYANAVTADNQALLKDLQSYFKVEKSKLHLVRWGLDAVQFNEAEEVPTTLYRVVAQAHQSGLHTVLIPRGLKPIYQADIILEAVVQYLTNGKRDTFFVVLSAGYEMAPQLVRQALHLQQLFPQHFYFELTQLTRREIASVWKMIDAFISAPVYDGYSAVVSEGRYVGAVPIVNAIPGNLEIIQHGFNGIIVEPFTVGQLHQTLLSILPNLQKLKAQFKETNKRWIVENGLIEDSAEYFVALAKNIKGG